MPGPKKAASSLKAERIQSTTQAVPKKLKAERIQQRIGEAPGWSGKDRRKCITRTYRFPNFRSTVAFVNYVAELAEACDHHPDIDIRYNKVTLVLSTHSEGGLTDKDFDLARWIDQT